MPRQRIPKAVDQCADQFVDHIKAVKLRKLTYTKTLNDLQGRGSHNRCCDVAEKSGAHFMIRTQQLYFWSKLRTSFSSAGGGFGLDISVQPLECNSFQQS